LNIKPLMMIQNVLVPSSFEWYTMVNVPGFTTIITTAHWRHAYIAIYSWHYQPLPNLEPKRIISVKLLIYKYVFKVLLSFTSGLTRYMCRDKLQLNLITYIDAWECPWNIFVLAYFVFSCVKQNKDRFILIS
jgi:hypothetical protein